MSCHSLQSLSYAELSFLAVSLLCRVVIPCSLSPMQSCHSLQSLSYAELSFLAVSLPCGVVIPCSLSPMQSCRTLQSFSHAELSFLAVSLPCRVVFTCSLSISANAQRKSNNGWLCKEFQFRDLFYFSGEITALGIDGVYLIHCSIEIRPW